MSKNNRCNIAAYLRVSNDDVNLETISISNQRALIKDYIARQSEFAGANVINYVDDGIGGGHTDRESYKQLIADVDSGIIDCI